MELDHLPVYWSQWLNVDSVRLRGIQMQLYAHFLTLVQADQPGECGIDLDRGYVLLAGSGAVAQAVPVDDSCKPALALHAGPPHEDGLLRGCIAGVRGAGGRWLAVGELDDDILGDLDQMRQRCGGAMAQED